MRTEVATWLENLDDNFLAAVHAMVGTYVKQQEEKQYDLFDFSPEAYGASVNRPITRPELIARAEASNADIEAGRVYGREEAEKMLGL